MYCSKIGYLDGVKYYLNQGVDIDYLGNVDKKLHNALSLAIQYHHNDIAYYLIDKGANLNTIIGNYNIEDVLDLSINYQNFEIAQKLIDSGVKVNWVNQDNKNSMYNSRIMKIASFPSEETNKTIQFYLENDFHLFEYFNINNHHLLTVACQALNFELMGLALEKGNNKNHISSITGLDCFHYLGNSEARLLKVIQYYQDNNIALKEGVITREGIDAESLFETVLQIKEQEKFNSLIIDNHKTIHKKIKI
jgi:ankyrin repeat protein